MAVRKNELQDYLKVEKGQIIFDIEGNEGGPWHSRTAHVPDKRSGVTIGRGYDVKKKTAQQIRRDFQKAGISEEAAATFAKFIGLRGYAARAAIQEIVTPEITLAQQKLLFEISYDEKEAFARTLCERADIVAKYGKVNWEDLNPRIKEMLVDLTYRGDYTKNFRKKIQRHIVNNNFMAFKEVVLDATAYDFEVPKSRLDARRTFLNKPLEAAEQASTRDPSKTSTRPIDDTLVPEIERKVPDGQPLTAMESSALEGFQLAQELLSEQAMLFGFVSPRVLTRAELEEQARTLMAGSTAALDLATEMARKLQQRRGFT